MSNHGRLLPVAKWRLLVQLLSKRTTSGSIPTTRALDFFRPESPGGCQEANLQLMSLRSPVLFVWLTFALLLSGADGAERARITEYAVAVTNPSPNAITAGPDGNIWFGSATSNRITRLTANGESTTFLLPVGRTVRTLTRGPDRMLWFTAFDSDRIGKMSTNGVVTEFPLPARSGPLGICAGPDGALWFTEFYSNRISRITTSGTITNFSVGLPAGSFPSSIVGGSDGNVWFTCFGAKSIGRITPGGIITQFPLPQNYAPQSICLGPDGALWFSVFEQRKIGRLSPNNGTNIVYFDLPGATDFPESIITGSDERLWFTVSARNAIGYMSTNGVAGFVQIPTPAASPAQIAAGDDGNLWFTLPGVRRIGRVDLEAPLTFEPIPLSLVEGNPFSGIILTFADTLRVMTNITFHPGDLPIALNDRETTGSELIVYGYPEDVIVSGIKVDVGITHPVVSDLMLELSAPSGERFKLINRRGGNGSNFVGTTFDLKSAQPVMNWFAPFTGRFRPEESYAPIFGQSPNGPWNFLVQDHVEGNPGVFTNWALTLSLSSPYEQSAEYAVNIEWGDGTSSIGTVAPDGFGRFFVLANKTYQRFGQYSIIVQVSNTVPPFTSGSVTSTVQVLSAPLLGKGRLFARPRGTSFTKVVGSFIDLNPEGVLSDFSSSIDWGDGITNAGTITTNGHGGFHVRGNHSYSQFGVYPVKVHLNDNGGSKAVIESVIQVLTNVNYLSMGTNSFPEAITTGADGFTWLSLPGAQQIARIDPLTLQRRLFGPVTESALIDGIEPGPLHSIWFTEMLENKIGSVNAAGEISEFDSNPVIYPYDIATGVDQHLWFTGFFSPYIGQMDSSGGLIVHPLPDPGSYASQIVAGPDGALWFTLNTPHIGRITTNGVITQFAIPATEVSPADVAVGPDGNIWFGDALTNRIWRLALNGNFTPFSLPRKGARVVRLVTGADSNLWYIDSTTNVLGRMSPTGAVNEIILPIATVPTQIAAGGDGKIWLTDVAANAIGQVALDRPFSCDGSNIIASLGTSFIGSVGSFTDPGAGEWRDSVPAEPPQVPKSLADFDSTVSTLDLNEVGAGRLISDVKVRLSVRHGYVSDLIINLVGPDGTAVTLVNRRGSSGADMLETTFDDQATHPIAGGVPPFTGLYRPELSLSAFRGKPATGTWTLVVQDAALSDTGVLQDWAIIVSSYLPATQTALYEANIAWGDGQSSTAGIVHTADGRFQIVGTNTYTRGGSYVVRTTLRSRERQLDLGDQVATVTSIASVQDAVRLQISYASDPESGDTAVLFWPASFTGYVLQYKTNLVESEIWRNVPTPPLTVGDYRIVFDPVSSPRRLYRLKK